MLIWGTLYSGFLRTFYLESQKQQSPLVLFRVGKHFFWRVFGAVLLCSFILVTLAWLIFLIIKQLTSIGVGFLETATSYYWLYSMCFILAQLILIKFLLFLIPLIIVRNCRIFESFKFLKYYKLLRVKELVALVACPHFMYQLL